MAGKPSCMTKERINKLEELDFEWNRADSIAAARLKREADGDGTTTPTPKKRARKSLPPGSVSNPQKWLNQLEQLKEYKKVNGNCRIKSSKRKGDDYDSLAKVSTKDCSVVSGTKIYSIVVVLIFLFCFVFFFSSGATTSGSNTGSERKIRNPP